MKKHLHTIYFATINGMTTVITIVSLLFIYVFIGVFNDGQVSSGKWDSILPIILLICLLEVCKWVSFGFIIVHKYPFIIFYFFYVSFIVYLSFHGMPYGKIVALLHLPIIWNHMKRWQEKRKLSNQ